MNRDQRQSLINQLWERDQPHVMIVKYDETERIGTQTSTITCHTTPSKLLMLSSVSWAIDNTTTLP
jgi:hypothetical protein